MDHVALAQTPGAWLFFFKSQRKAGMQPWVSKVLPSVSLVRHHSVREIYVLWRLFLSPEKAGSDFGMMM